MGDTEYVIGTSAVGDLTGTDILDDGGVIASMTERARRQAGNG